MFRKGVFIALMLAGLLLVAVEVILAADADIVISEVMFNSHCLGTDPAVCGASGGETRFEWVEIYNKGTTSVNLNGWMIRDNTFTKTIATTMCPGGSCVIGPQQCWVVGWNTTAISTEINNYGGTVDASRTISLETAIGGGLANTTDYVILKNAAGGNVDCVSWASAAGTVCSNLNYVSGGNGADTNLDDEGNGQSITNIQGTWYYHGPGNAGSSDQGSPYNCMNTAAGGSPTVITLSHLDAVPKVVVPSSIALALFAAAAVGLGVLVLRRRA